jgi:hypothetical protein
VQNRIPGFRRFSRRILNHLVWKTLQSTKFPMEGNGMRLGMQTTTVSGTYCMSTPVQTDDTMHGTCIGPQVMKPLEVGDIVPGESVHVFNTSGKDNNCLLYAFTGFVQRIPDEVSTSTLWGTCLAIYLVPCARCAALEPRHTARA